MSDEGVTRLSTIGEALRAAREAQGRSLHDAAEATRIRSSYLEALEEERFGELGGNVYAKGFLRSYAGYLGVDPAPLLEAYRAQETAEAPVFEHAPRVVGGLQPGRRGPGRLAVAIVGVSIILLVSLWGLLRPAPDPGGAQPALVTTPARTTDAGAAATPAAPPGQARRRQAGGQGRAGHPALRRRLLDPGHRRRPGRLRGHPNGHRRAFTARRSLNVVLGNPAGIRLTVNGKDLGVPDRSGSIWRHTFTPRSRTLD
jgi:transcriptional regulator with XRE-family HTH domain